MEQAAGNIHFLDLFLLTLETTHYFSQTPETKSNTFFPFCVDLLFDENGIESERKGLKYQALISTSFYCLGQTDSSFIQNNQGYVNEIAYITLSTVPRIVCLKLELFVSFEQDNSY